jgi:integrase
VALAAWLEVLDEQGVDRTGRIFRRVLPGGSVGEALSPEAVRQIVKRRCALAGLQMEDFSAHSLRSGFLTEAGRRGVPLKTAMDMSGHSSVATAWATCARASWERSRRRTCWTTNSRRHTAGGWATPVGNRGLLVFSAISDGTKS